jgi:glycosyltransferase involved in cell wall biosynthesis
MNRTMNTLNGKRLMICVVTPCYNEVENVRELRNAIAEVFQNHSRYDYRHLFIDNASRDGTQQVLRQLAAEDTHVQVILNARNFGHIRSPYHGLLQGQGDAHIMMASDFQDPPAMISQFLEKWEEGYQIIVGVKESSEESWALYTLRTFYYKLVGRISDVELMQHVTGFGLYDRRVIDILRRINDPYPYFRGLLSEIGLDICKIPFCQPVRKRGLTKNNFHTLFDMAMLGITNHSRIPLRMATMGGFGLALMSLLVAFAYLVAKLVFWNQFSIGIAPILIGIFFFGAVQLFFIGIIGEYIGAILTQVQNRPLVIERERINFD